MRCFVYILPKFNFDVRLSHSVAQFLPLISFQIFRNNVLGSMVGIGVIIPCSGRQRWLLKIEHVSARVPRVLRISKKGRAYPSSSCRSIAHSGRKPWWIEWPLLSWGGVCCRCREREHKMHCCPGCGSLEVDPRRCNWPGLGLDHVMPSFLHVT